MGGYWKEYLKSHKGVNRGWNQFRTVRERETRIVLVVNKT